MTNKVLIKLYIPEIEEHFDMFIPVNEVIWKVTELISKSLSDLTSFPQDNSKRNLLINRSTSEIYDPNKIIIDTDIRNATELLLLTIKK